MHTPCLSIKIGLSSGLIELITTGTHPEQEMRHRHLLALIREVRRLRPRSILILPTGMTEIKSIAELLMGMLKLVLPSCSMQIAFNQGSAMGEGKSS